MIRKAVFVSLVLLIAVLGMLAALAPDAAAQSCAMCYQSAAESGPQGREALRHGILSFSYPTISLFVGIFGLLYTPPQHLPLTI